jgi:hypothetical protein
LEEREGGEGGRSEKRFFKSSKKVLKKFEKKVEKKSTSLFLQPLCPVHLL